MDIAAGMRLGKYELGKELGRGGFGMVFVARDTELDRPCALKFLLAEHTANPELLRRFLKEARTAAKIGHLGIVTVYECGQIQGTNTPVDGTAFIAMEMLVGESLQDRLRKLGALEPAVAIEIARQIASALGSAHDAGIVHRDLKPDNIFIITDRAAALGERVKVLDFGIAKLAEGAGPGDEGRTGTHMIFGTPRYMSPEQCRSTASVDARTDIYALGVILFEMLSGARPFEGDAGALIAMHQLSIPPTVRSKLPAIDPAIDALVATMLAKSPADRPASMAAVVAALDAIAPPAAMSGRMAKATASSAAALDATLPPDALSVPPARSVPPATAHLGAPSSPASAPAPAAAQSVPPTELTRSARVRWPWLAGIAGVVALGAAGVYIATRSHAEEPRPVEPVAATHAAIADAPAPADAREAATVASTAPAGMVRLPAVELDLGSTDDEIAATFAWCQTLTAPASCRKDLYAREHPVRHAHVSELFLDAHERTTDELARWLSSLPDVQVVGGWAVAGGTKLAQVGQDRDLYDIVGTRHILAAKGMEHRPAVEVTYDGARRFCQAQGLELPTEAQWERAARGAEGRRFPWGNELPTCDRAVFGRAKGGPCPPGTRVDAGDAATDRTPEGVRGLGGNVAEWVLDRYVDGGYPACAAPCSDPVVAPTGAAHEPHVIRGGGYASLAEQLRGAGRGRAPRDTALGDTGFRCAGPVTKGLP